MYSIILIVSMLGQVAPAPIDIQQTQPTVTEMKGWLLGRAMIEYNFDKDKIERFRNRLNSMDEIQTLATMEVYKNTLAKRAKVEQTEAARRELVLQKAREDLEQAKILRDNLKNRLAQQSQQRRVVVSVRPNYGYNNLGYYRPNYYNSFYNMFPYGYTYSYPSYYGGYSNYNNYNHYNYGGGGFHHGGGMHHGGHGGHHGGGHGGGHH